LIYNKPGQGFITIESELLSEDAQCVHMASGKYLKKNIVSWIEIKSPPTNDSAEVEVVDDA
jgi:hypothetical protein